MNAQAQTSYSSMPLSINGFWYSAVIVALVAVFSALGVFTQGALTEETSLNHLLSVRLMPYLIGMWVFAGAGMFVGFFVKSLKIPSMLLAYLSTALGFSILFITPYESYKVLEEGHVGLNNLFQVSILLVVMLTLIGIWYDIKSGFKGMALFNGVVLILGALFMAWLYSIGEAGPRELVPALRSYWLPWHVVANFIGYGAFMVAAGGGVLELLRLRADSKNKQSKFPTVDECRSISISAVRFGFPIFTLAIILGSLWAYDSWGGYWSWDPKETWALIVWLCYAGYLHAVYTPISRGKVMPIWAIVGFFVTLFCYLGVNMFLDGLHSYGQLG